MCNMCGLRIDRFLIAMSDRPALWPRICSVSSKVLIWHPSPVLCIMSNSSSRDYLLVRCTKICPTRIIVRCIYQRLKFMHILWRPQRCCLAEDRYHVPFRNISCYDQFSSGCFQPVTSYFFCFPSTHWRELAHLHVCRHSKCRPCRIWQDSRLNSTCSRGPSFARHPPSKTHEHVNLTVGMNSCLMQFGDHVWTCPLQRRQKWASGGHIARSVCQCRACCVLVSSRPGSQFARGDHVCTWPLQRRRLAQSIFLVYVIKPYLWFSELI